MKLIVGIFLGGLLFVFLAHRAQPRRGGASGYAAQPPGGFSLDLGFHIVAGETCCEPSPRGLPTPENCVIPLAADYLERAPGYASPVSPLNVAEYCCFYDGEQVSYVQQSLPAEGMGTVKTLPKPLPQFTEASQSNADTICVPGTEVV